MIIMLNHSLNIVAQFRVSARKVAQVKKCTSYRLFLFRTIRKYLPLETRIKYYDYYVKPLIEYCSSV